MALGKEAKLMMMPASWIISQDPKRFGLLHEITQFHGPYTSAKARRDVPEFVCDVAFTDGAARVFADQKKRGAWKVDDAAYQRMVDKAAMEGIVPARA